MSYYPNYPTYFSYSVPYQVPEFYPIYQPYVSSNVPVIVGQASGHQVQHHNPYTRYETEKFGYNSRKDSQVFKGFSFSGKNRWQHWSSQCKGVGLAGSD